MASLIPGYEYDIFISYRQKDNKGDRWVSEFVDALKIELESTFKEEVSVYFDVNPHDGLLETHDVDASLKEKLRCLIFVPVISRTYCDPRSFAWEHEFLSFVETAHQDQFGLKVNLPNGNVASRVLPVRIHDLDITDIKLCETVLGGALRGVDFVYREAGVNRPLTSKDDEKKNMDHTMFRNQINKTANAIREIISGLKSDPGEITKDKKHHKESWDGVKTENILNEPLHSKLLSRASIRRFALIFMVILGVFFAYGVYRIITIAKTSKTIAVYFTADEKSDTTLKNIGIVYTEAIYSKLYKVKSLTLRPRIDLNQYNETEKPLNAIRKDLAVNYLLSGIIRRNGNEVTIWVELSSEKVNKDLWLNNYSWDKNKISQNTTEIVREIARNLNAKISPDEIKKIIAEPTKNAEANLNYTFANAISYNAISYNAWSSFTMGNKYMESISFNSAIQTYDKAIKDDPMFAQAYAKRAIARSWGYYTGQLDSTHIPKCLEDINKAIKIDKDLPDIQIAFGFYYYYCKMDLEKALEYFNNAAGKNPEDFEPLFYMAMVYRRKAEWVKSQNLIKKIIALDPQDALCLTNIGLTYGSFHNYDSALLFHQKAIDVLPVWSSSYRNKLETIIMKNGNIYEARRLLDTAIQNTGEKFKDFEILLDIYERKYPDALKESEKLHPSDLKFKGIKYLYQAEINSYLKNSDNARIFYDSAFVSFENDLKKDKNNHEIHSYVGIACAGLNNKAKAIEEGKKAVDLIKYNNFDKSNMIVNLAKIYVMVGEYDQAVSTIEYLLQTELKIPSDLSVNLLQLDPVWNPILSITEIKTLLKKYSDKKK
jgi:tetratricopeptide (TPR) repeat protein